MSGIAGHGCKGGLATEESTRATMRAGETAVANGCAVLTGGVESPARAQAHACESVREWRETTKGAPGVESIASQRAIAEAPWPSACRRLVIGANGGCARRATRSVRGRSEPGKAPPASCAGGQHRSGSLRERGVSVPRVDRSRRPRKRRPLFTPRGANRRGVHSRHSPRVRRCPFAPQARMGSS